MRFDLKLYTVASLVCLLGLTSTSIAQVIGIPAEDISLIRCAQRSNFASHAGRHCDVKIQLEDQNGDTTEIIRGCTTNARGICIAWRGTASALASTLDLTFLQPIDSASAFIANVSPVGIARTLQYPSCYTRAPRFPGNIVDTSNTDITKENQGIKRATTTYSESCVNPLLPY